MAFAKLIELDKDIQVLAELKFNDEESRYKLRIRTDVDGITAEVEMGFEDEQKATDALEKFDRDNAMGFRARMIHAIQ